VDFTRPCMESGLTIVAQAKAVNSSPWAFLKAFTVPMWCVTGAFFIFIGTVVWILEHRVNPQFRGSPGEQLVTICWLVSSTRNFHYQYNILANSSRPPLYFCEI